MNRRQSRLQLLKRKRAYAIIFVFASELTPAIEAEYAARRFLCIAIF